MTDLAAGALPVILPFLKTTLDLNYTQIGIIVLTQNVTSSVIQPIFGYITDKKSLPWLIPLGVLLAGIGLGITGFMPSYFTLLLAVILGGMGIAGFHPQGAKSAHFISAPETKGRSMGIFSVGGNLGMAVGAAFMMILLTQPGGLQNTIYFMIPGFIASFLLWRNLSSVSPQSFKPKVGAVVSEKKAIPYMALFILLVFIFLRSTVHTGLMTYIPMYYIHYLGGNPVFAGYLVSVFLLGGVIGTFSGATMSDWWGRKTVIFVSMIIVVPLIALFPYTSGFVTIVLLGITGLVLISSFATTLVLAQEMMIGYEGMASGLTIGFTIGLGGLGVTILGYIADHQGIPAIFQIMTLLPIAGALFAYYLPGRLFQRDV